MMGLEVFLQADDEFFEVWVVGGREAEQTYGVKPCGEIVGFCDFENSVNAAVSDRAATESGLAEAASAGTAAHDLDADAFVNRPDERYDGF
jgi:hypothetical protein